MTKVDIVSGFLGSGKTTFIKKFLEEKVLDEKIVIVENEFGKIGIDKSILEKSGFEIVEVNSGCICCTLVGQFSKAIQSVMEKYQPDRIIIEPSGVGKLSEVISTCKEMPLLNAIEVNGIVTVVDVLNYQKNLEYVTEFFEDQIRNANVILLSRTQKSNEEEINRIVEDIKRMNQEAKIVITPLNQLRGSQILDLLENRMGYLKEDNLEEVPLCSCEKESHKGKGHFSYDGEKVFQRWETQTTRTYTSKEIKRALQALCDSCYGMVFRAKGIVPSEEGKWIQFDFVPEEYDIKEISPDFTGRICVIGSNLETKKIEGLFSLKHMEPGR